MRGVALAALLLCAPAAPADESREAPQFNLVTLSAQAEREVQNDTLFATLAAEAEGSDPVQLADGINRSMRRALDLAAQVRSVQARSGSYQTVPVYDKNRVLRWRVRQELRLESPDVAAATELIGRLQSNLVVAQMAFGVSGAARRQVENALIAEALAAFEERARIAADALKAKGYRIRDVSVSGSGGIAPRAFAGRAMAAEVAAPALESGTTRIVMTANGTVQLQ